MPRHPLSVVRRRLISFRDALVNLVTDEPKILAAQVHDLTWERNGLVEQTNVLTGERNDLTGERNQLVGRVAALTGEKERLLDQAEGFRTELRFLRSQLAATENGGTAQGAAAAVPAPAAGQGHPRRAAFLIMSNMRCGSTWLETSLGALPDVATEYEMKWDIDYQSSPGHLVVHADSPPITELLAGFEGEAPVVGSKFVFDPLGIAPYEFVQLGEKLGPGLRIVHLVRDVREIFLSRRRSGLHRLDAGRAHLVGAHLWQALTEAEFGLGQSVIPGRALTPAQCFSDLRVYPEVDAWIAALGNAGFSYLMVRYDEIHRRFPEIAEFIGSEAKASDLKEALEKPAVLKLPAVDSKTIVPNIDELGWLFDSFEEMRNRMISS